MFPVHEGEEPTETPLSLAAVHRPSLPRLSLEEQEFPEFICGGGKDDSSVVAGAGQQACHWFRVARRCVWTKYSNKGFWTLFIAENTTLRSLKSLQLQSWDMNLFYGKDIRSRSIYITSLASTPRRLFRRSDLILKTSKCAELFWKMTRKLTDRFHSARWFKPRMLVIAMTTMMVQPLTLSLVISGKISDCSSKK